MQKRIRTTLFVSIGAAVIATAASATMPDGWEVNPVNSVVYEAVSEGAHGGAAFWCAAGTYAEVHLKAKPGDEIYVARGAGPSVTTNRRSAAQFTLDPEAAGITPAESSGDLNEPNVGEHMSAGQARTFCSTG